MGQPHFKWVLFEGCWRINLIENVHRTPTGSAAIRNIRTIMTAIAKESQGKSAGSIFSAMCWRFLHWNYNRTGNVCHPQGILNVFRSTGADRRQWVRPFPVGGHLVLLARFPPIRPRLFLLYSGEIAMVSTLPEFCLAVLMISPHLADYTVKIAARSQWKSRQSVFK